MRSIGAIGLLALLGFAACGDSAAGGGGANGIQFTGAITGTWTKQKAFDCTTSDSVGITLKGPTAADDVADITVKKDGSVTVDSNAHGSFSGTGGSLHAKSGLDVNSDLKSADGKTTHASGSVSC